MRELEGVLAEPGLWLDGKLGCRADCPETREIESDLVLLAVASVHICLILLVVVVTGHWDCCCGCCLLLLLRNVLRSGLVFTGNCSFLSPYSHRECASPNSFSKPKVASMVAAVTEQLAALRKILREDELLSCTSSFVQLYFW